MSREKPAANAESPPNVSLNLVEVIPSPSASGSEEVATLHVVTRAQAKNKILNELKKKSSNRRRQRRKNNKSHGSINPKELFENDHKSKSQDASAAKSKSSGRSPEKGSSVTMD